MISLLSLTRQGGYSLIKCPICGIEVKASFVDVAHTKNLSDLDKLSWHCFWEHNEFIMHTLKEKPYSPQDFKIKSPSKTQFLDKYI